eukprot:GHVR01183620.1.p1 GENE.GHVR01183620.1~~GHVR01183620.1.p1  ORF type:complete len:214 (+),score=41.80 GHVR01183620.1:64-705(+)
MRVPYTPRPVPDAERKRIVAAYKGGKPITKLADEFRRGEYTIHKIIVESGVKIRKFQGKKWTPKLRQEAIERYNRWFSVAEIERLIGISGRRIHVMLKEADVVMRSRKDIDPDWAAKLPQPEADKARAEIEAAVKANKTAFADERKAWARKHDIPMMTVRRAIDEMRLSHAIKRPFQVASAAEDQRMRRQTNRIIAELDRRHRMRLHAEGLSP